MKKILLVALLCGLSLVFAPSRVWACACGCGVFDVGTGSMFPTGAGTTVYFDYDYLNQTRNWSGSSSAPAANNDDKQIRTDFFSLGVQHMFNRKNGFMLEVPYWNRQFKTADSGTVETFNHSSLGDIRLKGIYTGFSPDMSSGLTYGVKLPTGDSKYAGFDSDTEIGTGSTDLLLGGYHNAKFANSNWGWFVNGELEQPVAHKNGYNPGAEINAVAGAYYHQWNVGKTPVVPLLQIIGSVRGKDSGALSNASDSGYQRVLFAPGLEVHLAGARIFAEVGLPIYQHVNGNQLTAKTLFKVTVSHDF